MIQQISSPGLDFIAQGITILSEEILVVAVLICIYYCIDKNRGKKLFFAVLGSLFINGVVKCFFKSPRPIGEKGIKSLRKQTATGYSFPSGHSQNAGALYFSLASQIKKNGLILLQQLLFC